MAHTYIPNINCVLKSEQTRTTKFTSMYLIEKFIEQQHHKQMLKFIFNVLDTMPSKFLRTIYKNARNTEIPLLVTFWYKKQQQTTHISVV